MTTLEQLADRFAITDLLASFAERIDEYDVDGVGALFTEDAVVDYGPDRRTEGRAALVERITHSQAVNRRTQHHLGPVHIILDGDQANSVTYVTAWHERWDGTTNVVRLQYRDTHRRTPTGWLIASREARATGADAGDSAVYNWVERLPPRA